jgi:hypothetical protein
VGGIDQSTGDADTSPINFLILLNCYVNKRLGALVPRGGSQFENIPGPVSGTPLGMGEILLPSPATSIPYTRELIANYGGTSFKRFDGASWTNLTVDADTSFDFSRVSQFKQVGNLMGIFSGLPGIWEGGATAVKKMGITPPPQTPPSSAPTATVTIAGNVVGSVRYYYTYRDTSTELESAGSLISNTVSPSSEQVDITGIVASTDPDVDQIRIYRADADVFRLVGTQGNVASTFTDNVARSDLGIDDGPRLERSEPPNLVFIAEAFQARFWCVDANDPRVVHYSEPYLGDTNELHYYPPENITVFEEPVTALKRIENRLLVFHPRNISFISGFSNADFVAQPFLQGLGTLFRNSVETNGQDIFFLSESGYTVIGPEGRRNISRSIETIQKPLLRGVYNAELYVHSTWSQALRQFVTIFTGVNSGTAPWVESGTGALEEWEDSGTMLTEEWEDSIAPGGTDSVRNIVLGYSSDTDQWHEYDFDTPAIITVSAIDLNADGDVNTFIFNPVSDGQVPEPQQEKIYMGTDRGLIDSTIATTHRDDTVLDDGFEYQYEWLTGRIVPGEKNNSVKRLHSFQFNTDWSDPLQLGITSVGLNYLVDYEDPVERGFVLETKLLTDRGDLKIPEEGKGRFFHLHGTGRPNILDIVLLTDFAVNFRESPQRQRR